MRHHWKLTTLPDRTTRVDDYESFLGPDASAMFAQHSEGMRQQLEPIMDALKSAVESRGERLAPSVIEAQQGGIPGSW